LTSNKKIKIDEKFYRFQRKSFSKYSRRIRKGERKANITLCVCIAEVETFIVFEILILAFCGMIRLLDAFSFSSYYCDFKNKKIINLYSQIK
jgi:hypothetical protein